MFSYDINDGWIEIEDFITKYEEEENKEEEFEESLKAFGFSHLLTTSEDQGFFQMSVFNKSQYQNDSIRPVPFDFIISVDLEYRIEQIAVKNFPSLVELLSKLSPISGAMKYFENSSNDKNKI